MRWLYHVVPVADVPTWDGSQEYDPPSLKTEGFIHGSFQPSVKESAELYFPKDAELRVLRIDPRRLDVPLDVAETPRGPMPHIHGPLPRDAVREVLDLESVARAPDAVRGSHFAFVAFGGMTLFDLVSVHDVIARVGRMKLDEGARFTFASATVEAWTEHGARFDAGFLRPDLGDVDVLVVPGGVGAQTLAADPEVAAWLRTFPANRLKVSVCTGALLLGAAGFLEGRRATTHHSALGELARFGAIHEDARVVHDRALVTGGGVTAGIDVGLHVVGVLYGEEASSAIRAQIEWN
ncbi:hypothetical protein BH09MYX1_BH09MYX1_32400 [soil metagenome]